MKILDKVQIILISDLILKINQLSDLQEIGRQFLESIAEIIPYHAATFYKDTDFQIEKDSDPVAVNIPQQALATYQAHYLEEDYTKWMFRLSKSMVFRESDLFSEKERMSTDYYQNIYVPRDIHSAAIMSLVQSNRFLGCCSLYRRKQDGDFSDVEIFLLDLLKDHLALALSRCAQHQEHHVSDIQQFSHVHSLTGREQEVLRLVVKGLSHEEICTQLSISIHTLKSHLQNIYQKSGASGKIQLFHKLGVLK